MSVGQKDYRWENASESARKKQSTCEQDKDRKTFMFSEGSIQERRENINDARSTEDAEVPQRFSLPQR